MLRTKQDVQINFKHYGTITVPKGTEITNETACGTDPRYNFVNEFGWIKTNYPDIASILKFDAVYHGIKIPKEFVEEVN